MPRFSPVSLSSRSAFIAAIASAISIQGVAQAVSSRFQEEMSQGVLSYRDALYADAVKHFTAAVRLDPTSERAHLYLATSYMQRWVPGSDAPESTGNRRMATQEYHNVLKMDPANPLALAALGSMAFNAAIKGNPEERSALLAEAESWEQRRIEIDPEQAEPYYFAGVINWAQASEGIRKARLEHGATADDPGR